VADYLGIDVTVVRLVAILFALMGHGFLLYLAGWLLMPASDGGPSVLERHRARRRT
jgi:phage shock protein PspC (stress-responsive transcriptional regulator)